MTQPDRQTGTKESAMLHRGSLLVAAGAWLGLVGGCKATFTVEHYPEFYDPKLESVAVANFANESTHARAGELVASRLAAALKANGTYKTVVGPLELASRLAAAGAALPPRATRADLLAALRKLGGIQAVLTGTVRTFAAERATYVEADEFYEPWYGGYYGYGRGWGRHHWGYGGWGWRYPLYRSYSYVRAVASADAELTAVKDGEILYAPPGPVTARLEAGANAGPLADEALGAAASLLAARLVETFAVAPMALRVDRGKLLRTARPVGQSSLDFTNDFREEEKTLLVVVSLPPEAALNEFRIVVAARGSKEPLASETFLWPRQERRHVLSLSPAALLAQSTKGKFDARLYRGDKEIAKRSFDIHR